MSDVADTAIDRPRDQAVLALVASNVLTLFIALVFKWTVLELLWPYWIQNVVIGFYARRRMLKLRQFSAEGFSINDVPATETPETQRSTANFFTLHYGFFHFGYFMFLASRSIEAGFTRIDALIYVTVGLAFLLTHGRSHREHVEADLAHKPNLGLLMVMPYIRVVPMHFVIIVGASQSGGGTGAVILFAVLKTIADVGMHKVEHHLLQRSRAASAA